MTGPPATERKQAPAGKAAVRAQGLTKRYGSFTAVDAVDFSILPGECFGFLGPNGAGKTSIMKTIYCASPVSGGSLEVLGLRAGRDDRAIKARLGVVHQDVTLDQELSVWENLQVYARYFDLDAGQAAVRAGELLDFVDLADRRRAVIGSLSGGMQRRLQIARALINRPDLLILDEPTTGLDPQARHHVWDRLRELRARGVTLILTTHYMDEAEQLCDRLVIMDRGRIVATGTPRDLITRHAGREVVEVHLPAVAGQGPTAVKKRLFPDGRLPDGLVEKIEVVGERALLFTRDGERLAEDLAPSDLKPASLWIRRANLEDVFLRLTGRSLVE